MTAVRPADGFGLKRVQDLLGLSRGTITGLIDAGFVTPSRGPRNSMRFSFQDLLILRTAFTLQQASVPPRKILRALVKLRDDLPESLPLTGLRITAVGADVAVHDPAGIRHADTGQLLMDFEVSGRTGEVTVMPSAAASPTVDVDWFRRGESLEATDPAEAEAAYRRAIDLDPTRAAPWLNLGAALCESGRCDEAVSLYEQAIQVLGHDPAIHFNRAIALEDRARDDDAIAAYERVLALSPDFADAHYNLGILLERRGDAQGALRHFNAYRRLDRGQGA